MRVTLAGSIFSVSFQPDSARSGGMTGLLSQGVKDGLPPVSALRRLGQRKGSTAWTGEVDDDVGALATRQEQRQGIRTIRQLDRWIEQSAVAADLPDRRAGRRWCGGRVDQARAVHARLGGVE